MGVLEDPAARGEQAVRVADAMRDGLGISGPGQQFSCNSDKILLYFFKFTRNTKT